MIRLRNESSNHPFLVRGHAYNVFTAYFFRLIMRNDSQVSHKVVILSQSCWEFQRLSISPRCHMYVTTSSWRMFQNHHRWHEHKYNLMESCRTIACVPWSAYIAWMLSWWNKKKQNLPKVSLLYETTLRSPSIVSVMLRVTTRWQRCVWVPRPVFFSSHKTFAVNSLQSCITVIMWTSSRFMLIRRRNVFWRNVSQQQKERSRLVNQLELFTK